MVPQIEEVMFVAGAFPLVEELCHLQLNFPDGEYRIWESSFCGMTSCLLLSSFVAQLDCQLGVPIEITWVASVATCLIKLAACAATCVIDNRSLRRPRSPWSKVVA